MPLKIFIPDESEYGGRVLTTHTNTDISFIVRGSAVLNDEIIVETLSLTKDLNDPFKHSSSNTNLQTTTVLTPIPPFESVPILLRQFGIARLDLRPRDPQHA